MTARQLTVRVYAQLVELHGREVVDEAFAPRDRQAEREARRAQLVALGVEVG